jgi:uncharacterized protein YbjT (DUF2867 family)
MRIAVAGGTGTVGREIVARARERGHDPVVLARSEGVDLETGSGLDGALEGVGAVIDAVGVATLQAAAARRFFRATAENLVRAAQRAGLGHVVLLSIIGIDRNPHGYYAGKVVEEEVVTASPVPWSILRAAQFHEFAGQIAGRAALGPVQLAPRGRVQPVAAASVAERLIEVVEAGPSGRVADLAGPREEELSDMVRTWVRSRGRRGPVVPASLPGAQMRGMRAGAQLPGAGADLRGPTFAEWLASAPIT